MSKQHNAIRWRFPKDGADQWAGFNDSGIEHFRGRQLFNLARETIQNSLDAPLEYPVKVSFRLTTKPTKELPGRSELTDAMRYCLEVAKEDESENAAHFFEKALKQLNKKSISVLTVRDENTQGISGPCKNGTPLYAFMKASGQSKKNVDEAPSAASGSYGIGKYAPYVVSNLRTVFVSTVGRNVDSGQVEHYAQGKSILMSHYDKERDTRQSYGYWGHPDKCTPIRGDHDALPGWMKHYDPEKSIGVQRGTSLHLLAFNAEDDWQRVLAASVAENFFAAIAQGKLEVDIDNKWELTQESIEYIFNRSDIREAISDYVEEPENFDCSKLFLEAEREEESVILEDSQQRELGHCSVKIYLGDGHPKRVGVVRNGMLISQELQHLKRFSDFKDFVAVVQCHDDGGNALLRAMEPPRHDDFQPERLPTPEKQRQGRRALKELGKWVREMLKRHAQNEVKAVSQIDELKDYFGDDESEEGDSFTDEINPLGRLHVRAKPVKQTARSAMTSGADRGGTGSGDRQNKQDGGGGRDGKKGNKATQVNLHNVRAISTNLDARRISFTPDYSGTIALEVFDSGADTDVRLNVTDADKGGVKNGRVSSLPVAAQERITVHVKFGQQHTGAIKVTAHAI